MALTALRLLRLRVIVKLHWKKPTTESIVTESSVVESEYYPITEGQRYLGVYVQGPEETDVLADSINTLAWFESF